MKRILVCSDLSERSRHAVVRASRLARDCSASLTVCSIVDDDLPSKVVGMVQQEVTDDLKRACASLDQEDVDVVVKVGEPVQTILSIAADMDADLIVLGTHRHRPFWDMVSGTTMERIAHASRRPVLLVAGPVTSAYASVLAGIDFSPSCEAALRLAHTLAPSARFTTFHAVEVPSQGWFGRSEDPDQIEALTRDARAGLDAWWQERSIPAEIGRPQIIPASVPEALRKMRYEVKPDLIAIGAHGRPGFASSLLGGFTETIIRWQFCDVLVVRA